jgi:hypothetical protein
MKAKLLVLTIGVIFSFILPLTSINIIRAQQHIDIQQELVIPDSAHLQILTTTDGSSLIGRIVEIGDNEIQFQTDMGKIPIQIAKIKKIKEIPVTSFRQEKYWYPNPNYTRLYFAPTGRALKKGEGYFASYYIFFPMVAYGITNNITVAGGFSLIPWIGIDKQLFYIAPKIGIVSTKDFALSTGVLYAKLPSFDDGNSPSAGIIYGVGTYGDANNSLTAGLGYGFTKNNEWQLADKPMFMVGGEVRVSRPISLVTENWVIPGTDAPFISYGLRFFSEKISIDFAFINYLGGLLFPGIPYVDFVVSF